MRKLNELSSSYSIIASQEQAGIVAVILESRMFGELTSIDISCPIEKILTLTSSAVCGNYIFCQASHTTYI
jgi:hypothetical protein